MGHDDFALRRMPASDRWSSGRSQACRLYLHVRPRQTRIGVQPKARHLNVRDPHIPQTRQNMLKRLIRTKTGLFCLSWIVAFIVMLLMLSVRWRTHNKAQFRELLASHDGFVLVFWHERILSMPWLWPRRHAMTALQSPHPDGRMLAHTVNHLGVRTVWGSSNRNALSGLRGMKRILDTGQVATVTPDGPRGPARVAAIGPVALSRLAGKPILPVAWSTSRFWRAPGWDGMMIPKPFSSGVFVVGEPIAAPTSGDRQDLEAHRARLQEAMNAVSDKADALCRSES